MLDNDASKSRAPMCIFYDMLHSNNSARIRIWLRLHGGLEDCINRIVISHDDLHNGMLEHINPLKKVPAFRTDTGLVLFESFVILQYLEDRFGTSSIPSLVLDTPDDRAFCHLLVRVHDLYISSPNCTQPNFSHTQGCMYLDPVPTAFTPASRTMDVATRAAKLAEIYKHLVWMEGQIRLPYMAGDRLCHADCTWFPTCIFMELLLPHVFDWSPIFHEKQHFPRWTMWFATCRQNPSFEITYQEIHGTLKEHQKRGRFQLVQEVPKQHPTFRWKYI